MLERLKKIGVNLKNPPVGSVKLEFNMFIVKTFEILTNLTVKVKAVHKKMKIHSCNINSVEW